MYIVSIIVFTVIIITMQLSASACYSTYTNSISNNSSQYSNSSTGLTSLFGPVAVIGAEILFTGTFVLTFAIVFVLGQG